MHMSGRVIACSDVWKSTPFPICHASITITEDTPKAFRRRGIAVSLFSFLFFLSSFFFFFFF